MRGETGLEEMAQVLERDDDYRVLRRLRPRRVINPPSGKQLRTGLFVDVETTGLDPAVDEIIELAMVPFSFSTDGVVYQLGRFLVQLSEPKRMLPSKIEHLTGLSLDQLSGQSIDLFEVTRQVRKADLVVAHNARFDRPLLERLAPVFRDKPWACTMSQIPWDSLGFESTKLEYLGLRSGFFFDGHRAAVDCLAGIELLATHYGEKSGLKLMLEKALVTSWRIRIVGSPFDANPILRERGYRWMNRSTNDARGWEIEVDDAGKHEELTFLRSPAFDRATVTIDRITPFERFSDR